MLVTVVGNYPKIPARRGRARLRTTLASYERGEVSLPELQRVEDDATREVLMEQEDAGVELLTDGQVRWLDDLTYFAGHLGGVTLNGLLRFFDTNTYFRQPVVVGDILWREPITLQDYEFACRSTTCAVKAVLPGPYTLAKLSRNERYRRPEELTLAYAEALNREARALQAAGPPLIQFNEPAITQQPQDVPLAREAWRLLIEGVSAETAIYFYFGPPGSAVAAAVEAGFTTIGVDATIPGVLDALRDGARPEKLAAGVVDARTTRLEPHDEVTARIRSALSLVPDRDLYVNPNMGLEFLPRESASAKLRLLSSAVLEVRRAVR